MVRSYAGQRPGQGRLQAVSGGHEEAFCAAVPRDRRREMGQFFTPAHTARLMADWIAGAAPLTVLDPAVGPGRLLAAAAERLPAARLLGYDRDPLCLSYAADRLADHDCTLTEADFLTAEATGGIDAVIANPPYLRHRGLPYDAAFREAFAARHGVDLPKMSNAYLFFAVKALSLLRPGGRAALLLPAEWANANFGQAFKDWLARSGALRHVIYFNHAGTIFDDTLSTGCLLLLETGAVARDVETHYANADCPAESLADLRADRETVNGRIDIRALAGAGKWDRIVAVGLRPSLPGFVRLGELARTRRGIATGANAFFMLSAAQAESIGISPANLHACIGKARDVEGLCFAAADLDHLSDSDRPSRLLALAGDLTPAEAAYVAEGVRNGFDQRYLTRKRSPWYAAERQAPAPIWAATFGRGRVRFVLNEAGALTLTPFHCVYPERRDRLFLRAMVACLNAPIVQERAQEVLRVYGGGLHKVEPRDLLEIGVPDLRQVANGTLARLGEVLKRVLGGADAASLDGPAQAAAREAAQSMAGTT